jgi:hypothetical protein
MACYTGEYSGTLAASSEIDERAQAWPDHAGGRYFTRMTIIHTGSHSYRAGGTLHTLPETVTYLLSPFGGA